MSTPTAPAQNRWPRVLAIVFGTLLILFGAYALLEQATRTTEERTDSVTAADVRELHVDVTAGRVDVVVEDRDDITVETRTRASFFRTAEANATVVDDRLELVGDCSGPWLGTCNVELAVALPADSAATVEIRTTAGDVDLVDLAGDVTVRTTAGDIDVRGFRGDALTIRATAGDVDVEAAAPPASVEIRTTAGDIDLRLPAEAYAVDANATAGDVDVAVDQSSDSPYRVSVSTTAGDITVQ